jgi:hypothetical protein
MEEIGYPANEVSTFPSQYFDFVCAAPLVSALSLIFITPPPVIKAITACPLSWNRVFNTFKNLPTNGIKLKPAAKNKQA